MGLVTLRETYLCCRVPAPHAPPLLLLQVSVWEMVVLTEQPWTAYVAGEGLNLCMLLYLAALFRARADPAQGVLYDPLGYTAAGTTFADGSTHGTGTMSGTVQARSSVQAATQFRTDNGSSTSDTLSLTFDSLYNTPSSLAAIAGNYTDANTGTPITISSSGTVFGQSAATGCAS